MLRFLFLVVCLMTRAPYYPSVPLSYDKMVTFLFNDIATMWLSFAFVDGAFHQQGFPGGSDSKASVCNAGDLGSIPGLGRSLGEGNGSPLQYSCLKNSMDREAW